jgi:hypothetical protein
MAQVAGRFACDSCGKQFKWKPQLAGKQARCACGALIAVPQEDDVLLDLLEPVPAPVPVPVHPQAAAGAAPAPSVPRAGRALTGRALEYQSTRTSERISYDDDKLMDTPRDLYVPVALLGIAFIGLIGWAMGGHGAGTTGAAFAASYYSLVTVIKTVVLTGLALILAPRLGISFGMFWTAVLKFAAMLIFTDVALLWLRLVMEWMGAARPGWISLPEVAMMVLCAMVIISLLCLYLFNMDVDEVKMFALPLALFSCVLGFILKLVTIGILMAAAPPPPAAAPAPGGAAAPAPQPLEPVLVHPSDLAVAARLKDRRMVHHVRDRYNTITRAEQLLLDDLLRAGAVRAYIDTAALLRLEASRWYIELPADPDARAACIEVHRQYCRDRNIEADESTFEDQGQHYWIIELKYRRKK